ncbi:hypothetical protein Btru_020515 [Bulinus truncatus]|nr:hypothetical protein Btru_020515 [Bulinus truncatus]
MPNLNDKMSAVERDGKKRRKRKTRAERNQSVKHQHDVDKQTKFLLKSKRVSEHFQSQNPTSYSLRSSKGVSLPCLFPKDFVKTTAGNITQGRLLRPLAAFENAKSSIWTSRAAMPETEEMKKNVEKDLNRILNLSGLGSKADNDSVRDNIQNACDKLRQLDNQHDNMEVDPPFIGSHTENSSKRNIPEENSSLRRRSPATTNATPVMSENSPMNQEEELDSEPPIQDIADSIMKELKPKFDKLFANRDVELENCCDLEKLIKLSALEGEVTLIRSKSTIQGNKKPLALRSSRCNSHDLSAQPVGQDVKRSAGELRSHHCPPPHSPHIFTSTVQSIPLRGSGQAKQMEQPTSAMLITNVDDEDDEEERIMTIKLDNEDNEDESNSPDMSVSYNEFVDSARELKLKLEQQNLLQLNRFSYQDNSLVGSTRPVGQTIFSESGLLHHRCHTSDSQHFQLRTSCGSPDSSVYITNVGLFGNKHAPYYVDRSLRDSFVSPAGSRRYSSIVRTGHSLAQSRYNFQEALDTACRMSESKTSNPDCGCIHFNHSSVDKECCGRCRGFNDRRPSISSHSHSSLMPSYPVSQPLRELQSHQADLQRQAKDFLDDLDQCTVPFTSEQSPPPQTYSRHLFQMDSPESNSSPVWMSSITLKDVGLETRSSLV